MLRAVEPAAWLAFLQELADAADALALGHFRSRDLRVDTKPDRSLVTAADLAIEEAVRRLTRTRYPGLGIFGEEQGESGDRGDRIIVDPIDATANFARGIPIFATLLALELEGEVVAGLVSAPALATRWWAARGAGAHRNGKPIRVSGVRELSLAQAFHGSHGGSEAAVLPDAWPELLRSTHRQRGFGDFYQHVLVAEGAGELAFDPVLKPWDAAPLIVLAEEAGGAASALDGTRSIYAGSLLTTNGHLHEQIRTRLLG